LKEVRFHREVYEGTCVDSAIGTLATFGTFEQSEDETHWIVQVTAKTPARELRLARELGNFALGYQLSKD
jgi:hypothetical protein